MQLKLYTICGLLLSLFLFSQEKRIETRVDSSQIKIGAQLNLILKTQATKNSMVLFPENATFGAFEVLESYPIDTLKKTDSYELIKRYGLTQFDSGKYTLPRLSVVIDDKIYFSDSLQIEVKNVVVDTLKQKMYDIRPIIEPSNQNNYDWLWYLLLLPLAYGIYYLIQKFRNRTKKIIEEFKTPIEKATVLLTRLEEKKLWQKGEVKNYYSELTQIIRIYIEDELHVSTMESTSAEVISNLKEAIQKRNLSLNNETIQNLDRVLKNADLVKFAKSKPLDFEITEDRKNTENIILSVYKSIPVITEESIEVETEVIQKKQSKKFITKKKLVIAAMAIVVLFYFGVGLLIQNMGIKNATQLFFSKSSKSVYEGEWFSSEYGYPSIRVETPEILQRVRLDTVPNMKGVQQFSHDQLQSGYRVIITSSALAEDQQADLDKGLEISIAYMESQGAQNIIVNQDDYETVEGFTGKKAFGTMSVRKIGLNAYERVRYEMLLFSQQGAFQQILIIYKDSDPFAEQIKQRIINSVELKKTN